MSNLTGIEIDVLRMIAGGMTPAGIAFALDMTRIDFDQRVADAIAKLKASNTDAAVAAAIDAGLIPTNL